MSGALDLSLDDLIKSSSKPKGGRGGRTGGRGAGRKGIAVRAKPTVGKAPRARNAGPSARAVAMAVDDMDAWQHDKFGGGAGNVNVVRKGGAGDAAGTKLLISNLHPNVTTQDVKELFAMAGELKKASVNFDQSGRSKGTAEVVFARRADAVTAQQRYNGATLDGMPMSIEAVAPMLSPGASMLSSGKVLTMAPRDGRGGGGGGVTRTVTFDGGRGGGGVFARTLGSSLRGGPAPARGGRGGRGEGAGRGRGRGRGAGRGRGEGKSKSAVDLDAELDSYHAASMQE